MYIFHFDRTRGDKNQIFCTLDNISNRAAPEDKPLNKLPCLLFIIPFLLLVMLAVLYSIPAASVKIIFVLLAMSFKLNMIPIALFEMFKAFAAISRKVP